MNAQTIENTFDFVVVGSGAGGGPLAANLALAGFDVLVLEAGSDKKNLNYSIPAFHAKSTEDPEFSWEFFVDHYSKDPDRDPKYHAEDDQLPNSKEKPYHSGIFYPRASTLGGCTAHHAMITVCPHRSDWEHIESVTKDSSWDADNMRTYFDRVEKSDYRDGNIFKEIFSSFRPFSTVISRIKSIGNNSRGDGWLPVTQADATLLLRDTKGVLKIVKEAVLTAKSSPFKLRFMPGLDPNHPDIFENDLEGINSIPISVGGGRRFGARERLLDVKNQLDRLDGSLKKGSVIIKCNHFVTEIIFEPNTTKATGVECAIGEHLYEARHHDIAQKVSQSTTSYFASKEIIICGGAFNTPQILMLSGIGDYDHLRSVGMPEEKLRVNLPGVGRNLQDRYEVSVVAKAHNKFRLLDGAQFSGNPTTDMAFKEWQESDSGIYATNGAVIGFIMRSSVAGENDPPDLYIFGIPGDFQGYEIGYSSEAKIPGSKDHFSWVILKGHTNNRSGEVRLRSLSPFDAPKIHFKYFEESNEAKDDDDLKAVIDGVKFAKKITDELIKDDVLESYVSPSVETRNDKEIMEFIRKHAWGHHASCTCKIGSSQDPLSVLDSEFKVIGTENLRVVDASVFPKIPGLFILASVYTISEKASEILIQQYNSR